jgi:hypothetical protein
VEGLRSLTPAAMFVYASTRVRHTCFRMTLQPCDFVVDGVIIRNVNFN